MKKLLAAMSAAIVTVASMPDAAIVKAEGNASSAASDYVVFVDKTVEGASVIALEDNDDILYEDSGKCIYAATMTDDMAAEINASGMGICAEPDFVFEAMEEDDNPSIEEEMRRLELDDMIAEAEKERDMKESWNIRMVHGNQETGASEETVVAVLDSGVDFMTDASVDRAVNLVEDEQYITYYMSDMTGHGSAVADIVYRMNPNASIYSVRVLDSDNQAPLSRIIEGVRWCMDNDVDVINMSFGAYQDSKALRAVIEEAAGQGIVVVAAAGNSGDRGAAYPAAFDDVLSVGAVDAQAQKTEDSAIGDGVDLVAPGDLVDVQSMLGLYTTVGGTSIAAAHASGAASVLMEQPQDTDSEFVRGLLKESANPVSEEDGYGSGLLDLDYALESYDDYEKMYEDAVQEGGEAVQNISLEENPSEPPVFSEEEVKAEALWRYGTEDGTEGGHYHLARIGIDYAESHLEPLSAAEAEAYKKGAVAPDDYKMSSHFHGAITQNYITSYRFITKIAKENGDTANISKGVTGQADSSVNAIKSQISLKGLIETLKDENGNVIGTQLRSWKDVIGADYTGSDAKLEKLRRIFIYGMALHAITDTFAHDAYAVHTDGNIYRIEHRAEDGSPLYGADTVEGPYQNRYEDAKRAARRVIITYNGTAIGGLTDFRPVDTANERGYYLGELMTCAKKANYGFEESYLLSLFGKLTYDKTGLVVK